MATKRKRFSLGKLSDSNREILFDILAREKVDKVTVQFEGSGDDGSLESSDLPDKIKKMVVKGSKVSQGTVWHPTGETTQKWKEDCTVEEIVQSLCYEVLELTHGGWENNDGAYGEFNFDVKERTAHLDFNERYTESELYEHDF